MNVALSYILIILFIRLNCSFLAVTHVTCMDDLIITCCVSRTILVSSHYYFKFLTVFDSLPRGSGQVIPIHRDYSLNHVPPVVKFPQARIIFLSLPAAGRLSLILMPLRRACVVLSLSKYQVLANHLCKNGFSLPAPI